MLGKNEKAIELLTPLPANATEIERVLRATSVFDRGKLLVESEGNAV